MPAFSDPPRVVAARRISSSIALSSFAGARSGIFALILADQEELVAVLPQVFAGSRRRSVRRSPSA
jgi:hypothetical protein